MPRLLALVLLAGCVDLSTPAQLGVPPDGAGAGAGADLVAEPPDAAPGAGADTTAPVPDAAVDRAAPEPDAAIPADAPAPDAAPPDAPLTVNGRPCSASEQCLSRACVDGVCCSGDCAGPCLACNVPGSAGTCAPISAGQDPDDECPMDPVAMCGRDGTCNGQGACRRYREGTECAPGGCTGAEERAASTCNGAGVCTAGAVKSCAPLMCASGACAGTCAQQSDCQAGFFCDGTACRARRPAGQACTATFQCASNYCVDGVCCSTPCTEACHTCALPAALGTCSPAPAGQDPRTQCAAEAVATCGRLGGCDGQGGCRLHPMGTACGAPQSCAMSVELPASSCDGLGTCQPGTGRDCGPYRCNGTSCHTTCTTAAHCRAGHWCSGTTCVPLPAPTLHWKLDETSGTMAMDASGNGFHGTFTGGAGPVTSTMVPPVAFANPASRAFTRATRNAIQLAPMPAAIKPATDLTLSAWYRATGIDTGPGGTSPMGSELISGGDNYLMRLHVADLELSKRTSNGHMMCLGLVSNHLDGNWHHAALTYSATAMKVYFDGVERLSCATALPFRYDRGTDLFVGRHGNDVNGSGFYDFEGNIDDVRIYARTLSPQEIAALAAGN